MRYNQVAEGHADGHDSEMNVMGDMEVGQARRAGKELVAGVVGGDERPAP